MATYPYTYLAGFMNPGFQQVVVARALKRAAQGGPLKQRVETAARNAGVSAPGFRPGKIPLQQLARPLVTPVSRASQVSPFTAREEIAAPIFALWVESQPELRATVAEFLGQKGLPVSETLPPEGFADTLKVSEMDALVKEMGVAEEGEPYDDAALMLVCLLGRAPVFDDEADEERAGDETELEDALPVGATAAGEQELPGEAPFLQEPTATLSAVEGEGGEPAPGQTLSDEPTAGTA